MHETSHTHHSTPYPVVPGTANPHINHHQWTLNRHTDRVEEQPMLQAFEQVPSHPQELP